MNKINKVKIKNIKINLFNQIHNLLRVLNQLNPFKMRFYKLIIKNLFILKLFKLNDLFF